MIATTTNNSTSVNATGGGLVLKADLLWKEDVGEFTRRPEDCMSHTEQRFVGKARFCGLDESGRCRAESEGGLDPGQGGTQANIANPTSVAGGDQHRLAALETRWEIQNAGRGIPFDPE